MARKDEEDEVAALLQELNDTPDEDAGAGPEVEIEAEPAPGADPVEREPVAEPELDLGPGGEPAPAKDKEQRMVPYDAMYAERAKRQDLEREREEWKLKLAEIEQARQRDRTEFSEQFGTIKAYREQLEAEQQRRAQQEAEASAPKKMDLQPIPDWQEDPQGHVEALNANSSIREHNLRLELQERAKTEAAAMVDERMKPIDEAYTKHQTTIEQQTQEQQLFTTVGQREQAFAIENADYFPAIDFYKAARFEDYKALGLQPEAALQAVHNEMKTQAKQFVEARMDPAQSWYNLAKRRNWAGEKPAEPNGALNGNAQEPAAKPQPARAAGKPSVETMQRGMAASDGLANAAQSGGSSAPSAEQALDKMLDLPEAEIAKRMDEIDKLAAKVLR